MTFNEWLSNIFNDNFCLTLQLYFTLTFVRYATESGMVTLITPITVMQFYIDALPLILPLFPCYCFLYNQSSSESLLKQSTHWKQQHFDTYLRI